MDVFQLVAEKKIIKNPKIFSQVSKIELINLIRQNNSLRIIFTFFLEGLSRAVGGVMSISKKQMSQCSDTVQNVAFFYLFHRNQDAHCLLSSLSGKKEFRLFLFHCKKECSVSLQERV